MKGFYEQGGGGRFLPVRQKPGYDNVPNYHKSDKSF
jgi:hypothetical protein